MKFNISYSKGKKKKPLVRIPHVFLAMAGFEARTKVTVELCEMRNGDSFAGHCATILKEGQTPTAGNINLITYVNKKGFVQIPEVMTRYKNFEVEYNTFKRTIEIRATW